MLERFFFMSYVCDFFFGMLVFDKDLRGSFKFFRVLVIVLFVGKFSKFSFNVFLIDGFVLVNDFFDFEFSCGKVLIRCFGLLN